MKFPGKVDHDDVAIFDLSKGVDEIEYELPGQIPLCYDAYHWDGGMDW